jgi:3-(3-hydroxy-phenyl)propionate hydroxylase
VCILDPAAAAARDAHLLAERAKITEDVPGQGFGFPPMHSAAFLAGSPAAGELFIQPWSDGLKWDDVSGDGAYLIAASPAPVAGVRTFTLDDPKLAPFAADFRRWLDSKGVDAVLVRPDRYVFGTGAPADLAAAWTAALH